MRGQAGLLIDEAPGPPAPVTTLLVCFALGIVAWPVLPAPAWIAVALSMGLMTWVLRRRAWHRPALAAAIIALAATLGGVRFDRAGRNEVRAFLDETPQLVTIEGIALAAPAVHATTGSMRRFDHRGDATVVPLAVRSLRAGAETVAMRGVVRVWIAGNVPPFRLGSLVTATGTLRVFAPPPNPGWPRVRPRLTHDAGAALFVSDRGQLVIRDASPSAVTRGRRVRAALRDHAATTIAWLAGPNPPRRHLLDALLLGRRGSEGRETDDRFRRVGLAHLLAISGMHLGIVLTFALGATRGAAGGPRVEGLVILGVVAGYLFLVETRLPVLRAGVMAACLGCGRVLGRRGRLDGIIALGGLGLLVVRPDDLFRAGFQLSFAVVLGLVHLTPTVRRRWFGPRRRDGAGVAGVLRERARDAVTAATVAWLVAAPIIMHHFGLVSPLTVPLTLVALPAVTAVLGLGYAAVILQLLAPGIAGGLGPPLRAATDLLLGLSRVADATPGATVCVTAPSMVWTFGALAWVWWWGRTPFASSRRRRRAVGLSAVAVAAWYVAGMVPLPWHPAVRLDMLAVGNGSCVLASSRGERLLFDAGSMTSLDAGRTRIVPALRRLGVRRLSALAVSHPDLDHYSAALEVVDAFPVGEVLLTPAFLRRAKADPDGPEAYLIGELLRRDCPFGPIVAGASRRLGAATLQWRHPGADDRFAHDNDGSMVVEIRAGGRRALLTGDLADAGIATLLARYPCLRSDVLELPHHGSGGPASHTLVARLDPRFVLQSTGPKRLRTDAIGAAVAGRTRLVTARDGASTIVIDRRGRIRTRRHRRTNGG